MNRPPVASEMIDYISARVFAGNYRPGSRIPSVRALMRRFNLSYGSALNGISYLCDRQQRSPCAAACGRLLHRGDHQQRDS